LIPIVPKMPIAARIARKHTVVFMCAMPGTSAARIVSLT
jgi:hypothetical protein